MSTGNTTYNEDIRTFTSYDTFNSIRAALDGKLPKVKKKKPKIEKSKEVHIFNIKDLDFNKGGYMREFLCPVCKAPIVCTYEKPDLYFYQDENDDIVRDTNEDLIYGSKPYFHFYCSFDKEDDIKPLDILAEFIEWKKEYTETMLQILLKEGFIV